MCFLLCETSCSELTVRRRAVGLRAGITVDVVELGASKLTEEDLSIRREVFSIQ